MSSFFALAHINEATKLIEFIEFILDSPEITFEQNDEVIDITSYYKSFFPNQASPFAEDFDYSDLENLYLINNQIYRFDLSNLQEQAEYNSLLG